MFTGTGQASGTWEDVTSASSGTSPWVKGTGSIFNHGGATYGSGILVVLGNENKNSDQLNPESQTWIWDKGSLKWRQVSNVVSPAFRDYHAMASLENGRVVMFGGRIKDAHDGSDTRIFDSNLGGLDHGGWFIPNSLTAIRPLFMHGYCAANYVIMFGGQTSQDPGVPLYRTMIRAFRR